LSNREEIELSPGYRISRVVRGGWQLAGGHGPIDRNKVVADLLVSCEEDLCTFDCADIYTGVEDLLGQLRTAVIRRGATDLLARIKIHTKFVPDLHLLPTLTKADVYNAIDRSLRRLRMERLDLVQLHWWDYELGNYVEAAQWLKELQQEGKITLIGGTNFDTSHTKELLKAGIPLTSMQVQYSLLDARPDHGLTELCKSQRVHLLCYGTVAGGFLSDAWLGRSEPFAPFENRSLTKYKLVVEEFGGWALLQELLRTLRSIADDHGVDIATVASRALLERPQVSAVIVGARNLKHLAANLAILDLRLSAQDLARIDNMLRQRRGPKGDVFTLERDRSGPHGSIMKYDLNRLAS
jgi:aryl-alcohol dehydrogenase-like predicted oxidoreductase